MSKQYSEKNHRWWDCLVWAAAILVAIALCSVRTWAEDVQSAQYDKVHVTLPEGYTLREEDGQLLISDDTQVVGGVTAYHIPEGVYDPYDKWFMWLEDVGIPDYSDDQLMLDGSMSDFGGGWTAEFRSLPEGDGLPPVKRRHSFKVMGDYVYDVWMNVDILGPDEAQTLAYSVQYDDKQYQTVTVYPEGEAAECKLEAVVRAGYTVWLPETGWPFGSLEILDGIPTDTLEYGENENIRLHIATLGGKDLAAAQRWAEETYPQYDLVEDKRGGLGGTDDSGNMLCAAFYPAENVTYAVIQMYPMEAAEGGGVWLSAFADTFTLNEDAAMTQEEADYLRCMAAMGRVGYSTDSPYWICSVQERDGAEISIQYLTEGTNAGDKQMMIAESDQNGFYRAVLLNADGSYYCNAGHEEEKLTWHPCEEEHEIITPLMISSNWNKHYTRYLGRTVDADGEKISYQMVVKDDDGGEVVLRTVDFYFNTLGDFLKTQWEDFSDPEAETVTATEYFCSLHEETIRSEIEQAYQQAVSST